MFDNEWSNAGTQKRDYLQGHVSSSLIAGQSYCVTFYIVQELVSFYNVNHIGAYFDDGTIDTTHNYGLPQTQYAPQIIESAIISDTLNWTKIQGSFIANGTERLITIGNFTDTAHMDFVPVLDTSLHHCVCTTGLGASWYLVDDISVIKSDAVANAGPDRTGAAGDTVLIGDTLDSYLPAYWYVNGVAIDSNKSGIFVYPDTTTRYVEALQLCGGVSYDTVVVWVVTEKAPFGKLTMTQVNVWPNPVRDELHIDNGANDILQVYDMMGRAVYKTNLVSDKETVNIANLPDGVYVAQINDPLSGYRITKRIVKE